MKMKSTITKEGIQVAVGQVWRDLDKRFPGATKTIVRIDEYNGLAYYERPKNRLRIDRMHKPFWELVSKAR